MSRMLPEPSLIEAQRAEVTLTFTSEKVFEVHDGNRIGTVLHVGRAGQIALPAKRNYLPPVRPH
jgi:hypothetical protein